ncbi:MAG TPA: dienelactone hydrolase family protein [Acidimicrobiia bacterium]
MTTTGGRRITTSDGGWFDAHVAVPDGGTGPGILLCHEALGTTDYLRGVADRLATIGYVVVAPDAFWRLERNVSLAHDDAGLARAGELLARFDTEAGVRDMVDALAMLTDQPEVTGPVGVVGHCFGGLVAYLTACAADPDCLVSYYGVGIDGALDRAASLTCPSLLHFGTEDLFVPVDTVNRLRAELGTRPNVSVETYDGAGHAFENPHAPWYDPRAATAAWDRTVAFLAEHLGN